VADRSDVGRSLGLLPSGPGYDARTVDIDGDVLSEVMLLTAVIVGSLCTVVGALTMVVAIRRVTLTAWTKKAALNEEDIAIALIRAVRINEKAEAVYLEHQDARLLVIAKDSKEIHSRLTRVMYRTYGQGRLFDGQGDDPEAMG